MAPTSRVIYRPAGQPASVEHPSTSGVWPRRQTARERLSLIAISITVSVTEFLSNLAWAR